MIFSEPIFFIFVAFFILFFALFKPVRNFIILSLDNYILGIKSEIDDITLLRVKLGGELSLVKLEKMNVGEKINSIFSDAERRILSFKRTFDNDLSLFRERQDKFFEMELFRIRDTFFVRIMDKFLRLIILELTKVVPSHFFPLDVPTGEDKLLSKLDLLLCKVFF